MTTRCQGCGTLVKPDLVCPICFDERHMSGIAATEKTAEPFTVPTESFSKMTARLPTWSSNWLNGAMSILDTEDQDRFRRWIIENGEFPTWMRTNYELPGPQWFIGFFSNAERMLRNLWLKEHFFQEDPAWFSELQAAGVAGVSRLFILHGNINDYHYHPESGYLLLEAFLEKSFGKRAAFYSLSQGFSSVERPRVSATVNIEERLLQRVQADFHEMDRYIRGEATPGRVLVVTYLERLFPAGIADIEREFLIEMILRWAVDPKVPANNLIIFSTTNYEGLHPDLKSRLNKIQTLAIPRPDLRHRAKYIAARLYSQQGNAPGSGRLAALGGCLKFGHEFGKGQANQVITLANKTAGLNNMGIEDLMLRAMFQDDRMLTVRSVSRHKKTLMAGESYGLLDVIEPRFGFEVVGGLIGVQKRLLEICRALDSSDPVVRRTIPMGILFLGPPGTGKSLMAEALAWESKLTFVKLGNFRGMYVGQSEQNLSLALELIRSLAPVVVFVDEIDQNLGRRGNSSESGPEKRLFARILEFMSDTELRSQVLWIGASNVPSGLDDAFKRAGRFDLKLPFFLPGPLERESILKIKLNNGSAAIPNNIKDLDVKKIVAKTDGFSGAELEVLVNEALRIAVATRDSKAVLLEAQHLENVLHRYDPSDAIAKYRKMELEIAKDVPDADLLPEHIRSFIRTKETPHAQPNL